MKRALFLTGIFFLLISSLSAAYAQQGIEESGKEFSRVAPVGMIVPSLLPPLQFNRYAGPSWVPADGRNISPNTLYAILTGQARVPDLRGMFLRGLNDFSGNNPRVDGKEDPDGVRRPGDYQEDKIKRHRHLISSRTADTGIGGSKLPYRKGGQGGQWWSEEQPIAADETRPKNIAVFYYIKIN